MGKIQGLVPWLSAISGSEMLILAQVLIYEYEHKQTICYEISSSQRMPWTTALGRSIAPPSMALVHVIA
jgi:hypothetical protein